MRRSNDFSLFIISGVPYLLPFGQGIADLKRGVRINDTGRFLWELLGQERTEEDLLSLCAAHYGMSGSQITQLEADLRQFLQMLGHYGMLWDMGTSGQHGGPIASGTPRDSVVSDQETANSVPTQTPYDGPDAEIAAAECNLVKRYLTIGGFTILLHGPGEAFSGNFDAFEVFPKPSPHGAPNISQTVTVVSHAPVGRPDGRTLLNTSELAIIESGPAYTFLFPNAPGICQARLTKDGTHARYYCRPPYTEAFRQDLFHAIRISFLYFAQLHNMVVLHSASLLYRGKAWLFSGHSGAGKSTHTNLWKELYGVPLLNGDLNLLSMENGQPTVHGLPWCGTSGIADIGSYPLGGIFLVKKSPESRAVPLPDNTAQLLVSQRLISPSWTEALLQKNLDITAGLAPNILICRLYCTKTPDAVEAAREMIDKYEGFSLS